jgi:predicted permease
MRLYKFLLLLYPASFRDRHGKEMAAIFAESRREARGPAAVAGLWLDAFADSLRNGLAAHLELLRQDVGYAFRYFRRAPGYAATVIAVAALGIGATTAAYSLFDHVLFRQLPYPESERLLKVYQNDVARGYSRFELSPANYRDWKEASHSFSSLGTYHIDSRNLSGGGGEPTRVAGAGVSAEFFPTLAVPPSLGRVFDANDDRAGAPGTLVLGHRLWRDRFGGDPRAIGSQVQLDDELFTVIGVMPEYFRFPSRDTDYWKPQRLEERNYEDRDDHFLIGIGRLAPGVTAVAARGELEGIAARLAVAYPATNKGIGAGLFGLRDELPRGSRTMVMVLFAASLSLLLIACINLASLLVARSLGRQKELALRSALGAGSERLVRQLLTECLVLAGLGSLLGLLLAAAATPLAAQLVPTTLPLAAVPAIDWRVLLFALLVTLLTAAGFGILPSLKACRDISAEALREGLQSGQSRRKERLRGSLVVAEVALSLGLLLTAGLLGRALFKVNDTAPGFDSAGVFTVRTWLPHPRYEKAVDRNAFYTRVIEKIEALPGVEKAAYTSFLPMVMGGGIVNVRAGDQIDPSAADSASRRFVTPGYFQTLGIPLLAGRDVEPRDVMDSEMVAVISESFARRFWPDRDPLGLSFDFGVGPRRVVGVVGDVKVRGLERTSEPQIYLPSRQVPDGAFPFFDPKDLAIRSSLPPARLLPELRRIVAEVDPAQPLSDPRPLDEIVAAQTAPRSTQARMLAAFALAALLLAGIGVHGLLAYIVSSRRPELGIRMALGARARDLVAQLAGQVGRLALAGIAIGAGLGLGAGLVLESILAGVSPGDPATLAVAIGAILLTLAGGSLLPLRSASRVEPAEVIRQG